MPAQNFSFKWVRDEDLAVTVYDLRVVNSATHTKASSQEGSEVTELEPAGITLRVPRELCALGHILSIELTFRRMRPDELAASKKPERKAPVKKGGRPLKPKPPGQLIAKLVTTGKVIGLRLSERGLVEVEIRFY